MNVGKISDKLDTTFVSDSSGEENSLVLCGEKSTDIEQASYTDNIELLKEINQYKDERNQSIETLTYARELIKTIITDANYVASLIAGKTAKDMESFTKIVGALTDVTEKIDELTNPSKVEVYINPPDKEEKEEGKGNINNNYFIGNPSELLKLLKNGEIQQ